MKGIIYWHPIIYRTLMKLLYRNLYHERYEIIDDLIPENCTVLDLCCGDSYIYLNYLIKKNIDYCGMDFNSVFIKWLKKRGVNIIEKDISKIDDLPETDIIMMMGSLYHFIPEHNKILDKMFNSAKKMVIISEPAENVASSNNLLLSFAAKAVSLTQDNKGTLRFEKDEVENIFNQRKVSKIIKTKKDFIGVWYIDKL